MVHLCLLPAEFGLHQDRHPAALYAYPHPRLRTHRQLRRPRRRHHLQRLAHNVRLHRMHPDPGRVGPERPGLVSLAGFGRDVELGAARYHRLCHLCAAYSGHLVAEDAEKPEDQPYYAVWVRLFVCRASTPFLLIEMSGIPDS